MQHFLWNRVPVPVRLRCGIPNGSSRNNIFVTLGNFPVGVILLIFWGRNFVMTWYRYIKNVINGNMSHYLYHDINLICYIWKDIHWRQAVSVGDLSSSTGYCFVPHHPISDTPTRHNATTTTIKWHRYVVLLVFRGRDIHRWTIANFILRRNNWKRYLYQ